jgi:hypothetical protein
MRVLRCGGGFAISLPMHRVSDWNCVGLSNTCPQVCATRGTVTLHGQVSNQPKHVLSVVVGP